MNNYVTIDLMKYIPEDSYVKLDSGFRIKFFSKAIKKAGTRAKLAKIMKTSKWTIDTWKFGRKERIPLNMIIKCAKFINFPIDKLPIKDITALYSSGAFSVDKWKLTLNENFSEWLGMLNGDGSVGDRHVRFSNTHINMPIYFAKILEKKFRIKKNRIKMLVSMYTEESIEEANKIIKFLGEKGYTYIKLYKISNHKGKKIGLTSGVEFKALAQLLKRIIKDLRVLINKSPNSVKAAYVRGFAAAEGCISESKSNVRIITITQNNPYELNFIKSLLSKIGISNIDGPRYTGTAFRIGITTQFELENFQNLIGFGKHTQKNKALKKILTHYKFAVYRTPSRIRHKKIIEVMKIQKHVTASSLAKTLSLSHGHINFLLSGMLNKGIIGINKEQKPRVYFLSDQNEQNKTNI